MILLYSLVDGYFYVVILTYIKCEENVELTLWFFRINSWILTRVAENFTVK